MIGQTFSHYRILSRLGAGGMGVVYLARDERLQREVAIKVLPEAVVADARARERLLREARLASQLNHPNVCTIHEVGDVGGVAYIAMERVDGRPLDQEVGPRGLQVDAVVRYGTQIADALAAAHAQGVVHRDLKCANVLVTDDGRVKVLDFGLAIRVPGHGGAGVTQEGGLTVSGSIVGTPHSMAPEILRGGVADARSDLWSLGVMLHEMACGARPFSGTTEIELAAAILHAPPEPLPARVPPALAAIVGRCLAKDPLQRFRTAGEVRAALEGVATGTAVVPPAAPPPRAGRRAPAGLAPAAALLAVLAGLALFDAGGLRSRWFPGGGGGRITSLAVLPLDNFSHDPEQQYFADGMTEELITTLAQIGTLRVISRTSVMGFRDTKLSMPEIGRKLGVDAIVEGSVQRSGSRVRITAQLIRAANDEHMWAHSYERDLSDALALQDEVAGAIAREVQATLAPRQARRMASARPVSPKAYELYLRGLDAYRRWDQRSEQAALEFLKQAIREDSTSAPAWAALGLVYLRHPGPPAAHAEEVALARQAVERALALEPDLGLAHALKGQIEHDQDWNWAAAERDFRRACELSPNLFEAHHQYSHLLLDMGRIRESEEQSRIALALDPLSAATTLHMGWHLLLAGRYEEAMEHEEATLRIDPSYAVAYMQMAMVHLLGGRLDEAAAAQGKAVELTGIDSKLLPAIIAARRGRHDEVRRLTAELLASARGGRGAHELARLLAQLGRKDEAFTWLDRAVTRREPGVTTIKLDPLLAPLRDDPRFAALLRRMGLPA